MNLTARVSVMSQLDPKQVEALDKIAYARHITRVAAIREALDAYIKDNS